MRILMVHKKYKGGVAVHVKEISKELRRKGVEVSEITRNEDLGLTSFLKSYLKMKELFKEWNREYDIIHTHDWSIAYPAIKSGIKNLVATFHAFPTNFFASFFQNNCIKKLNERAIVVSPSMKKIYKNATYIPNGVNLDFFKKVKTVKRNKLLVGIAQNYNKQKIIEKVRKVGLSWISTEGKLPFNELPEFYSKIDIFVSIPYKQAGFNLVWLEALACEVPYVIGTDVGIGEILPIYKISSFNELEDILHRIKNNDLKPLKSLRGWIIKNKLTWEASVNKLVKLYSKVLK